MGPITLFDKSFLQSLSLNESVWFDHFFLTNVCPIFFTETLADLQKQGRGDKSPEEEVSIIANKLPEMHSQPSAHHNDLGITNLLGNEVPMTGQIVMDEARLVSIEGKPNVISGMSPITEAFYRWHDGEFEEIERSISKQWRKVLSEVQLAKKPDYLKHWNEFNQQYKSFKTAYHTANNFIISKKSPFLRLEITFLLLEVPTQLRTKIQERFTKLGYPSLNVFAPYAAYIMSVIIFFILSLQSGLISSDKKSNLTDFSYIFYLPFCMIFVSSDKLHKTISPFFLRDNQSFVWGYDLKESLKELELYYSIFPEEQKEKGIHLIAPNPPNHIENLVAKLWDEHIPSWRINKSRNETNKETSDNRSRNLDDIENAPDFDFEKYNFKLSDIESVTRKVKIRKKKGDWYQAPKDLE